jgi:hypothetical protein
LLVGALGALRVPRRGASPAVFFMFSYTAEIALLT